MGPRGGIKSVRLPVHLSVMISPPELSNPTKFVERLANTSGACMCTVFVSPPHPTNGPLGDNKRVRLPIYPLCYLLLNRYSESNHICRVACLHKWGVCMRGLFYALSTQGSWGGICPSVHVSVMLSPPKLLDQFKPSLLSDLLAQVGWQENISFATPPTYLYVYLFVCYAISS